MMPGMVPGPWMKDPAFGGCIFFTFSIQNKQAFIPGPELPLSGEGYSSRTAGRGLKDKVSSFFFNQATVVGCGTFFSGEFVHSNARLAKHGWEMLGEGNPFWSSATSMAVPASAIVASNPLLPIAVEIPAPGAWFRGVV